MYSKTFAAFLCTQKLSRDWNGTPDSINSQHAHRIVTRTRMWIGRRDFEKFRPRSMMENEIVDSVVRTAVDGNHPRL